MRRLYFTSNTFNEEVADLQRLWSRHIDQAFLSPSQLPPQRHKRWWRTGSILIDIPQFPHATVILGKRKTRPVALDQNKESHVTCVPSRCTDSFLSSYRSGNDARLEPPTKHSLSWAIYSMPPKSCHYIFTIIVSPESNTDTFHNRLRYCELRRPTGLHFQDIRHWIGACAPCAIHWPETASAIPFESKPSWRRHTCCSTHHLPLHHSDSRKLPPSRFLLFPFLPLPLQPQIWQQVLLSDPLTGGCFRVQCETVPQWISPPYW